MFDALNRRKENGVLPGEADFKVLHIIIVIT